jgi:hypothetical protein
MSRPDMIGIRPLRPAANAPQAIEAPVVYPDFRSALPLSRGGMICGVMPGCRPPAPAPPPQPALVIRETMEKSMDLLEIHKSLMKGPFPISEPSKVPDVSTPKHEHARLQAKKIYLQEKLAQHQAAGHHPDHPEVTQRRNAMGVVDSKLKDLEAAGHASDPSHHSDWMHYLSKNPGGRFTPEHVNTGLSAHLSALGGAKTQAARRSMGIAPGMGSQATKQPLKEKVSATDPTVLNTAVAPVTGQTKAEVPSARPEPKQKWGSTGGPQLSLMRAMIELLDMVKSKEKKSDDWISDKIRLLMHEGKPQDQAIAIAYSMAGRSRVKKSNPPLIIST